MFNIVVSSDGTSWETDQLMRLLAERFTEYSGSEGASFSVDDPASLASLEGVPTLLMYEWGVEGPNADLVRYGFVSDVKKSADKVVFRFEEHGHIDRSVIDEFSERLGMDRFEHGRTHWAIKDGDIPSAVLDRMTKLFVGDRRAFNVFYAWQSDHPGNSHKRFIREALDAVAKRVESDLASEFTLQVDQDTQGVPGLCDIPATILEKIASCDAFVADLTYVARSTPDPSLEASPRYCSNPNVLFELGFAFRAIGWERLICVMNEKHGPSTEQIFDLDHRRHPIKYKLPSDGSSREAEFENLTNTLENAIRSIFPLGLSVDERVS